MILKSGIAYKSFAEQRVFSFDFSAELSNTSGVSNFEISGDNAKVSLFSFSGGKIFDSNKKFIYSYSPFEQTFISGNFRSGFFGYYINNNPVNLSLNVCSPGLSFDNFIISTSGSDLDFSINLFGETKPSYEIVFPYQNVITGNAVTGFIKNKSDLAYESFRLFSGYSSIQNSDYEITSNLQGIKIKPGNSGQFVLSSSGDTNFLLDNKKNVIPLSGTLYFLTNFGEISAYCTIPFKSSPAYFLEFQQTDNSVFGQTGTFWSFELERQACSGTRFEFLFEDDRWLDPYLSFSNSFQISTGYNNGSFNSSLVQYNNFRQCYIGTGFISGAGCSGDDIFNTRFEILHIHQSGYFKNRFKYSISGIEESFLFTGYLEQ